MRSVIGSHSRVGFFPYDVRLWTKYLDKFALWDFRDPQTVAWAVDAILADEKVVIADVIPDSQAVLEEIASHQQENVGSADIFDAFLRVYVKLRGKEIYGLKTPWNEFYADQILESFGDAVFVHVIRDPRKSALSAIFVDGGSWFYDPLLHLRRWKRSVKLAEENAARFGDRYHVVRYEDLAAEPVRVLSDLMPALGLDYEEGMERGDKQPGWTGTNTSFSPSARTGSTPRRELPVGLRFLYESKLSHELERWGYPVEIQSWARVALALPGLGLRLIAVFALHRGIELKSTMAKLVRGVRPPKPLHSS